VYAAASLALPRLVVRQLLRAQSAADPLSIDAIGNLLERLRQVAQIAHQPVRLGQGRLAEILDARPRVADHCVEIVGSLASRDDRLVEVLNGRPAAVLMQVTVEFELML